MKSGFLIKFCVLVGIDLAWAWHARRVQWGFRKDPLDVERSKFLVRVEFSEKVAQ